MSASISAAKMAEAGYRYIGRPYSEMDCQAFVERCLKDVGIDLNLPGSNAWYRRMTWTGTPEECRIRFGFIPVGAFLYILKTDGQEPAKYRSDGIGNASHIGIYTGRGQGAINSSSSRGCVCESTFGGKSIKGGWNRIGLWKELSYGEAFDRMFTGSIIDSSSPAVDRGEIGGTYTATVYAQSGSTVNLRSSPDKNGDVITRVPVGATVDVHDDYSDETWSKVSFGGRTGYMMSNFLIIGIVKPGDSGNGDLIMIDRAQLRNIYDKLGDLLGLRG